MPSAPRAYVRHPQARTLERYGLTEADYQRILRRQGWACGVCGTVPPSGVLHIEHFHARNYWHLSAEQRKKHVRGLACWLCNGRWLRKGATPAVLSAAAKYLEAHERRAK